MYSPRFHGFGRNGAFASYCNSRWNLLHVLPDSVSCETFDSPAVLGEC